VDGRPPRRLPDAAALQRRVDGRRRRLAIQKKLEEDAACPGMGWRVDRFAQHPYVKNLIPSQVTYNCCRLQEVWLDK
jgi:hypothetical protein